MVISREWLLGKNFLLWIQKIAFTVLWRMLSNNIHDAGVPDLSMCEWLVD